MKLLRTFHLKGNGVTKQPVRKQAGFSLIEVLVTMLILAFGLLGVAGLLVGGISNAAASESFSKVSQLVADMADRIRANPSAAVSSTSQYLLSYSDPVPTDLTTIANKDKKVWMEALAAQLPLGKGQITNDFSGTTRQYVISVRWSSCMGTISDTDKTDCTDNSSAAFRTYSFELRL